jgi:hypothetical protein
MKALWLAYYKALWCFRCYVWNPLGLRWRWAESLLDALDYVPRKWVSK